MSLYNKAYKVFSHNYLGYAMIGILISSCCGAGAAMLTLHQGHGFIQMFQIALLVAFCMGFNATILSNRKPKVVFNWGLMSIFVGIIILLIHLL